MKKITLLKKCEYEDCNYLFKQWGGKKYCFEHADMMRRDRIKDWLNERKNYEAV